MKYNTNKSCLHFVMIGQEGLSSMIGQQQYASQYTVCYVQLLAFSILGNICVAIISLIWAFVLIYFNVKYAVVKYSLLIVDSENSENVTPVNNSLTI